MTRSAGSRSHEKKESDRVAEEVVDVTNCIDGHREWNFAWIVSPEYLEEIVKGFGGPILNI